MHNWVVLELSPRAESEHPERVRADLARISSSEVFIPATIGTSPDNGEAVFTYVLGYAFVKKQRPDSDYLKLATSRWVSQVLVSGRALSTVTDAEVTRIRQQVLSEEDQGIGIGDTVVVVSGPYKNIEGTVLEEIPELGEVQILISLRSKQTLKTLPRSCLRVKERSPYAAILLKVTRLRDWVLKSRPLFTPLPAANLSSVNHYSFLESKRSTLYTLWTLLHGVPTRPLNSLKSALVLTELQSRLDIAKGGALASSPGHLRVQKTVALSKVTQARYLDHLTTRLATLEKEISHLETQIKGEGMTPQNIIVDGFNLAFRCAWAPGMSDLASPDGTPTGVIYGFLRSLRALKKKAPTAQIWVAWDGKSQRRRSVYGDYKAQRTKSAEADSVGNQIAILKELLPHLDVLQAYNPIEEADDVVASLVRVRLAGQQNLIYSMDRDYLQVVTEDTFLLFPAVGPRKEILYTPDLVRESYGVGPEHMPQLRAFLGDSSDNLPGCPRVPKAVLSQLVAAHKSIDALYSSGLAGVTKSQYQRLREFEPQARLNLVLMSLVNVDYDVTQANPNVAEATALVSRHGIDTSLVAGFLA